MMQIEHSIIANERMEKRCFNGWIWKYVQWILSRMIYCMAKDATWMRVIARLIHWKMECVLPLLQMQHQWHRRLMKWYRTIEEEKNRIYLEL
jgi:hypothetical protein